MIPRYKVQEIHDIWKTDNKLKTWLKVEMAHLESLLCNITDKTITQEEFQVIKENVRIDKDRWLEIEEETRHDVQAFVQMLEESIPDNSGRWIHYGLTSSDVLDTSLTLLCKSSLKTITTVCASTLYALNKLVKSEISNKNILSRTHGKSAEVQTYYNVFTRWSASLRRGYDAVVEAEKNLKYGKLSGVSGNNKFNSIVNESNGLRLLGLYPTKCSQIIPRDIYLDYFYSILKLILAIEKIAYDIRIYSIDGVNEMAEPFRKGQKGSSAMPHKKNPILTENICGLTRLYKSYMYTAIENCTTMLERDISHSASERIIFKDAAHICCFTLNRLTTVFEGLQCFPENSELNCKKYKSKVDSQLNMNHAIRKGDSRKISHDIAQSNVI